MRNRFRQKLFRACVFAIPTLWLVVFFALPLLVVLRISFSESIIGAPPYTPIVSWIDEKLTFAVNLGNYHFLASDSLYLEAYASSIGIALGTSFFCLILGYPMAYFIARCSPRLRLALLLLVILPFWTSFLLRIYAWIGLLNQQGLINQFALWLGLISEPLHLRGTYFSVFIGMTYSYLPLMILPLYANFTRLPPSVLESARDLGCRTWQTFLFVLLPLSKPGIIAGLLLVFIPAVGEFVIPTLLGSSDILMIGRILWDEFFANRDWTLASAVTITMLFFLIAPLFWLRRNFT